MKVKMQVLSRGIRLLTISAMLLLSLLFAGCFQAKVNVAIKDDGSVNFQRTVMGTEFMQEQIEKLKNEALSNDPKASVQPVDEGGMSGYLITNNYPNIKTLAVCGGNMFNAAYGKNKGVQCSEGIFFDAYSFDLLFENQNSRDMSREDEQLARAMLQNVRFDFSLNLPYAPDYTNAANISNDGKSLYWNLAGTLTGNKSANMQAAFRIWHKERIIIAIALALALLALTIVFAKSYVDAEDNNEKQDSSKIKAGICLLVLIALIGVSVQQFLSKPAFSDNDIISPVTGRPAGMHSSNANDGNPPVKQAPVQNAPVQPQHQAPAMSAEQYSNGYIKGTEVRIRKGPGTQYQIDGYYNDRENVQILEIQEGWYKVKRANGQIGWVSAQFCVII